MIILTLRTDKPEAEVGVYEDSQQMAYVTWEAHRLLAETLHEKIMAALTEKNLSLTSIQGVVLFAGPGSFTGLRIGASVANGLAYSLNVPIISSKGERWLSDGCERLLREEDDQVVLPEYGGEVHVSLPKK
jgi:tRNA threonylcarbamoyladenosine biosynthesis protein TsaB